MSEPEAVQLPAKPDKPRHEEPPEGESRIEVLHLLARVDDILEAFSKYGPFSPREVYDLRLRSARVNEILGEE
jgi:hypothetical protein